MPAFVGVGCGAVTFFLLGLGLERVFTAPAPSVTITAPPNGDAIEVWVSPSEQGLVGFEVLGTSTGVFKNNDLRVYMLIQHTRPYGARWWIQSPATVNADGTWKATVWVGNQMAPVEVGHEIDLRAVVAMPERVTNQTDFTDSKDLDPKAQSDTVSISIGTIGP